MIAEPYGNHAVGQRIPRPDDHRYNRHRQPESKSPKQIKPPRKQNCQRRQEGKAGCIAFDQHRRRRGNREGDRITSGPVLYVAGMRVHRAETQQRNWYIEHQLARPSLHERSEDESAGGKKGRQSAPKLPRLRIDEKRRHRRDRNRQSEYRGKTGREDEHPQRFYEIVERTPMADADQRVMTMKIPNETDWRGAEAGHYVVTDRKPGDVM